MLCLHYYDVYKCYFYFGQLLYLFKMKKKYIYIYTHLKDNFAPTVMANTPLSSVTGMQNKLNIK